MPGVQCLLDLKPAQLAQRWGQIVFLFAGEEGVSPFLSFRLEG